jgi:hypothetical protein
VNVMGHTSIEVGSLFAVRKFFLRATAMGASQARTSSSRCKARQAIPKLIGHK